MGNRLYLYLLTDIVPASAFALSVTSSLMHSFAGTHGNGTPDQQLSRGCTQAHLKKPNG